MHIFMENEICWKIFTLTSDNTVIKNYNFVVTRLSFVVTRLRSDYNYRKKLLYKTKMWIYL